MNIYSNIDQIGKVPNVCFGEGIVLYKKLPQRLFEIAIVRPSHHHTGYSSAEIKALGKCSPCVGGQRSSTFEGELHIRVNSF